MSQLRYVLVLMCSAALAMAPGSAQQSPIALLQQSLVTQVGNTQISDATLTGIARRIAGSDD